MLTREGPALAAVNGWGGPSTLGYKMIENLTPQALNVILDVDPLVLLRSQGWWKEYDDYVVNMSFVAVREHLRVWASNHPKPSGALRNDGITWRVECFEQGSTYFNILLYLRYDDREPLEGTQNRWES